MMKSNISANLIYVDKNHLIFSKKAREDKF